MDMGITAPPFTPSHACTRHLPTLGCFGSVHACPLPPLPTAAPGLFLRLRGTCGFGRWFDLKRVRHLAIYRSIRYIQSSSAAANHRAPTFWDGGIPVVAPGAPRAGRGGRRCASSAAPDAAPQPPGAMGAAPSPPTRRMSLCNRPPTRASTPFMDVPTTCRPCAGVKRGETGVSVHVRTGLGEAERRILARARGGGHTRTTDHRTTGSRLISGQPQPHLSASIDPPSSRRHLRSAPLTCREFGGQWAVVVSPYGGAPGGGANR